VKIDRFSAPTAKRLSGPLLVSITFEVVSVNCRGKLVGNAESLALLGPGKRQVTDPHQPGRRQFNRLAAFEDGLDDVGGEEGQRQPAAYVALVYPVVLGQIPNRWDRPALQFIEPAVTIGDCLDQNRIGLGLRFLLIGKDKLHLHAATFEADWELECEPSLGCAARWFAERDIALHAAHLDRAEDPGRARAYLAAAQAAAKVYHYEKAEALLRRGIEVAEAGKDRIDLLCASGELLHDTGRIPESMDCFRDALSQADDDRERCYTWFGLARCYAFIYRYESWVQFMSRPPPPQVDLSPLAEALSADESGPAQWTFEGVSEITPRMTLSGDQESSIPPEAFAAKVAKFLATASPAWDPYDPE
jgi:tetratricopeptide (TPR) repeat protein